MIPRSNDTNEVKKSDFINGEAVKKFEIEYSRYCKSKYYSTVYLFIQLRSQLALDMLYYLILLNTAPVSIKGAEINRSE